MLRWLGIVVIGVLVLDACTKPARDGGIASAGGAGTNSSPATATAAAGGFDPVKWAKCLREHGITVDDPQPGDGKPRIDESEPEDKVNAAADACRAYNPNWGKPPPPPDPAQVEQQRKFAQCMRDHGFDWPDPGPDGRPVEPPNADDPGDRRHPAPAQPGWGQAARECAGLAGMSIEGTDGPKGSK
jgi:hypothetical protein